MTLRKLILTTFLLGSVSGAAEIRLSPEGPISTPQAALLAARELPDRPVRIVVEEGEFPLNETLELGEGDSGLTWEAASGANPVFTGGKKIEAWEQVEDGVWKAAVPGVSDGSWDFVQLWVDGRRATRARTPNRGFFHIEDKLAESTFEGVKNAEYEGFVLYPKPFEVLEEIPKAELAHVLLTVPHSWSVGQCRIAALDSGTRSVRIKGKSRYGFLAKGPDQRIWMEGFRAAFDAPGEWYLDHEEGAVFYRPLPDETFTGRNVVAPGLDYFVRIQNAEDIEFRGIAFRHGQYLYPENGLHDGQAAVQIDGSIEVENSSKIRFENCEIGHIGRYGIYFKDGNSDCLVKECHLHDLGGGGVRIGSASRSFSEKLCRRVRIENCIIQHGGRLHPSACGVVLTHAQDCSVIHCDIGDFYYTGVSFGWNWGYGESVCRNNRLENCRIHHIGWAYLSDMGAFYNLGNAPGTVIRGNHVHHVACYDYGGWGLYNDEGSGDVLMEKNLVHDTSSAGFHQHYGYANRIRNNIFAFGGEAQIRRSRNEGRLTMIFENNIVLWEPDSPLLRGPASRWENKSNREKGEPSWNALFRRNLYWRTDGKTPDDLTSEEDPEKGVSWTTWKEWGRDRDSRFADPGFVNPAERNFQLKEKSPAFDLGFEPWNYSEAGVKGEEWRKLASRSHADPRWDRDAVPWPKPDFAIELQDFEHVGIGAIGIRTGSWSDLGKGESVGVVEGTSSTIPIEEKPIGKRSLRVLDAEGLDPSYHPVLNVRPIWEKGSFKVAFDVMSEANSRWFFELRGSGPFAAGPYLKWEKGKLTATPTAGVDLAEVPAGEWVRIQVSAETGTSQWTVELTREDGSTNRIADLPCRPEWNDASYLLWSGIGTEKAAFHLDNIRLLPEKEQ